MKQFTIAALGAGAFLMLAGAAQAMPVAPAPQGDALVEHVAQGCGPGFFRGPRGFCRPMGRGYGRPFYGPRPGYGRPDGPRRFYGPRW